MSAELSFTVVLSTFSLGCSLLHCDSIVSWLVFYGTFSINRLYHAVEAMYHIGPDIVVAPSVAAGRVCP